MKTIGMLGGMSWESTVSYYQAINRGIRSALGGLHSARIFLYSVDFAEIEVLQKQGDWTGAAALLGQAAKAVEAGGADFLLLCTNTMHKIAPEIEAQINIPILHIADATGRQLRNDGVQRVGLLGTRYTMEQSFYKGRLEENYGINVVIPEEKGRMAVNDVIFQELCVGDILPESRQRYLAIIEELRQQGAEAVIMGCTEIALLVGQNDTSVPLYDTTQIHVKMAIESALNG